MLHSDAAEVAAAEQDEDQMAAEVEDSWEPEELLTPSLTLTILT